MYEILKNEKYMGNYTFNKTARKEGLPRNMHGKVSDDFIRVEDSIPAIISEAEFMAVQEKREKNKHRSAAYTAKENYLLSGKIFCGCCGSAMAGRRYKPRDKVYVYYGCLKKERVPGSRCQQKQINKERLEEVIINRIKTVFLSEEGLKIVAKDLAEEYQKLNENKTKEKNALTTAKTMAERKLDNLYKLFENGAADEYDIARLQKIKAELKDVTQKLKNLENIKNLPAMPQEEIYQVLKSYRNKLLSKNDMETKKY